MSSAAGSIYETIFPRVLGKYYVAPASNNNVASRPVELECSRATIFKVERKRVVCVSYVEEPLSNYLLAHQPTLAWVVNRRHGGTVPTHEWDQILGGQHEETLVT